jgi:hypothetical protein
MQQVPEGVREIVGSMYLMLAKERGGKTSLEDLLPNATNNLLEQAVSH